MQQQVASFVPQARVIPRLQKAQVPVTAVKSLEDLELDTELETLSELIQAPALKSPDLDFTDLESQPLDTELEFLRREPIDQEPEQESALEAPALNAPPHPIQESLIKLLEMSELSEDDLP
jgi:hypothetical protein